MHRPRKFTESERLLSLSSPARCEAASY